jgi:hypothetical protein
MSERNEGARPGRMSLAVGEILEREIEPPVKARMLREVAV